jgi:ADP-heptose:LPS heptosyltransferase
MTFMMRDTYRLLKYFVYRLYFRGRKIQDNSAISSILVISLDYIGDAILTSPLFPIIRNEFPTARVTVLCGGWARDIYACIPNIDNLIVFNANKFCRGGARWRLWDRWRVIRRLKGGSTWDLAINIRGNWETDFLFLSGSYSYYCDMEIVSGRYLWSRVLSILGGNGVSEGLIPQKSRPKRIMQALEQIDIHHDGSSKTSFVLPDNIKDNVLGVLREIGVDMAREFVSIHPCAVDTVKLWNSEKWASLCDHIYEKYALNILFCGGKNDYSYLEEICAQMNNAAYNLAGKTTLMELCGIIDKSKFTVGIDSGPMHLSAALDTPLMLLIGFDDPQTCGPLTDRCCIIYHAEGDPDSRVKSITAEEAKDKVATLFAMAETKDVSLQQ